MVHLPPALNPARNISTGKWTQREIGMRENWRLKYGYFSFEVGKDKNFLKTYRNKEHSTMIILNEITVKAVQGVQNHKNSYLLYS